ncbi:MAG: RHS repeat protein, partial [Gammaproteobacteria bacterium]|nr:RHS repeat protein [Gammaproteobacteria bacterium]
MLIMPGLSAAASIIPPSDTFLHDSPGGLPGPYYQGQAVCEARQSLINSPSLTFTEAVYSDRCDTRIGHCSSDPDSFSIMGYVHEGYSCSGGFRLFGPCTDENYCVLGFGALDVLKNAGKPPGQCPAELVSHPINVASGNKVLEQVDLQGSGPMPVSFVRTYNSALSTSAESRYANWAASLDRRIKRTTTSIYDSVIFSRGDGSAQYYNLVSGVWQTDADNPGTLTSLVDANGFETGWRYDTGEDSVETYNINGQLISDSNLRGNVRNYTYDSVGRIESITNDWGQSIAVTYKARSSSFYNDPIDSWNTVTDQSGRTWNYNYDSNYNLTSVVNPDGTSRTYVYENSLFPHALTGIIDERGIRYATYAYDDQGRGITTTLANNVDRVDITYPSSHSRTVTNSRGISSTYTTQLQLGRALVTAIAGPGCSSCGSGDSQFTYDSENRLIFQTRKGLTTQFGNYDTNDNYGYKVIAPGTPEQRRTDYTYDSRFNKKITSITEPSVFSSGSKVTTHVYDGNGNRTRTSVVGYRPDETQIARTTTFQYNGPLNQL